MSQAWDFNFAGETPAFVDSGGRLQEGWYRAKLTEVKDNQQDGSADLVFTVTVGQFAGQSIDKKVWNPRFSNTPENAKKAAIEAGTTLYRLGLCTKEEIKAGKQIQRPFSDAIGREYVVQAKNRAYKGKDGSDQTATEVCRFPPGIYPLDHPSIPEAVRTALNLGPARQRDADDPPAPNAAPATASASGATAPAPTGPPPNSADIAKSLWG